MDWQELIQSLLSEKQMSLRQLAIELRMGNVYLSEVARGAKPASPLMKVRLLRAAGRVIGPKELMLLLPDEVAEEIRLGERKRS